MLLQAQHVGRLFSVADAALAYPDKTLAKLSLQAQHVGRIFSVADAALSELEPSTAVATVAAADALRKVLQAQEQLINRCSEASLTQLVAVVRDTSPKLQQACWLLVTQQETYKSQARICELLVVWFTVVSAHNKLCKSL